MAGKMKKTKKVVIAALLIWFGAFAFAAGPGSIKVGTIDDKGNFKQMTPLPTYEVSENVYLEFGGVEDNTVNIYIVKDRNWSDNDNLSNMDIIKSITNIKVSNNDVLAIWNASLTEGKYDIFVDNDMDGKYTKGGAGQENDMVEGWNTTGMNAIGFQVLPELLTAVLIGAGFIAMTGYFKGTRNA